jgi:acyl-CoA hydrolase
MGNVHGGLIMKLCDEAGGMTATKHASRPSVTVAVDSMSFHSPVNIGNLLTVKAEISWIGRSSMETRVTVTAEDVLTGSVTHTNTAYFVYVALGENGRPVPVPRLILETEQSDCASTVVRPGRPIASKCASKRLHLTHEPAPF